MGNACSCNCAGVQEKTVKVYGMPPSQNCVGPILLAMELQVGGMEFLNLMEGAHKKPEYLAINPSGKVPGLQDGEVKIGESMAILRFLAMRYGQRYYPISNPASCYQIDMAMDAFSKVYNTHIKVVYPVMGFGAPPPDQPGANKAYGEEIAKWFQHHVRGRFVLGDKVSIADFKAIPFFFAAVQPGVKHKCGFTPASRLEKYVQDVVGAINASGFMKSAGGYSIAEFIASKVEGKPVAATPVVEIGGPCARSIGAAGVKGQVKIHGMPASMNCVGPIMLAMESKAGAMQLVDAMGGALKQPDYLAINPHGQMPGLEDGTVKGGESLAVLRYLALQYDRRFYPAADPAITAVIDYAMDDFCSTVYEAHCGVVYPVFGFTSMPDDKAAASRAYEEAMNKWALAHLKKGKYVAGSILSIADFKAVPFFFAAVQPGVVNKMGLKVPQRIATYVEDFCKEIGASGFMKSAGGYSLAEFAAKNA